MEDSQETLASAYDLAMLDLDGVVYVGPHAVPGVAVHLRRAAEAGMRLSYVTNNASRPPEDVAAHLRQLGVRAAASDVVTSAQAAARLVSERCDAGALVFVIGGSGLYQALEELGLLGTQDVTVGASAVVTGYAPDLAWRTVVEGSVLIRQGVPWVASNTDRTIPTPHGPGPGAGVLVAAISGYAGVQPVVAGKPEPPLFLETQRRCGGRRPLVVGDRLDTDIAGATRAGLDSLLVMTGVTGLDEVVQAPPELRPTHVAADLGALLRPAASLRQEDGRWVRGAVRAAVDDDGALVVTGEPDTSDAWWQVVAAAAWAHLDETGHAADTSRLVVPEPPTDPTPD